VRRYIAFWIGKRRPKPPVDCAETLNPLEIAPAFA
jgi:hypothetical protein